MGTPGTPREVALEESGDRVAEELTGHAVRFWVDGPSRPMTGTLALKPTALPAAESLPAGVDPSWIPTSLDELSSALSRAYDLTITGASQLSIPVVGSVSGGLNRRVVVLERCAFKSISASDGTEYQYGYAIRLCVTVNKWDASLKVNLPFLAASAEVGQIQASWVLQVVGLAGSKIDEVSITPTELNVETFVLAKQSLAALVGAVRDSSTRFTPQRLFTILPAERLDRDLRSAAAKAYALTRIRRRSTLQETLDRIGSDDESVKDSIAEVYRRFVGESPSERPSETAARKSLDLLGPIQADV